MVITDPIARNRPQPENVTQKMASRCSPDSVVTVAQVVVSTTVAVLSPEPIAK